MHSSVLQVISSLSLVFSYAVTKSQTCPAREPLQDIPSLGFGTWNLDRTNASSVVHNALKVGFRHFDCAAIYGDEKEVGKGIATGLKDAVIEREDIWITSKLWNDHHSPSLVPEALNKTLTDLGTPYLDLYLMHWPVSSEKGQTDINYLDTWHAMTKLLKTGHVRHIGVSNFSPAQLRDLMLSDPGHPPWAHQLELHPYLQQKAFVDWHQLNDIHVTAYSPLGNMNPTYSTAREAKSTVQVPPLLSNDLMKEIANSRSCTPAQVALQWGRSRGTSVIPKSAQVDRIKENFASLRCDLQVTDIEKIESQLPTKRFNDPSASWGVDLFDGLEDATASRLGSQSSMIEGQAYKQLGDRARAAFDAMADL